MSRNLPSTPNQPQRHALALAPSLFSSPFRPSPSSSPHSHTPRLSHTHPQHESHASSPSSFTATSHSHSDSSRSSSDASTTLSASTDLDVEAGPSTPLLPTPSQEKAEFFSSSLARGSSAHSSPISPLRRMPHMLALGLGALTGRGKTKGKGRGARTAKVLVFALLGLLLLGLWTGSNGDGEEAGEVQRYELGSGAGSFEGKGAQTSKGGLGLGLGRFRPSLSLPYASWSGSSSSGGGSPGTLEDPYTPHPDTPYTAPSNAHRRLIDVASDPLPASATLEERLRAWEDAPGGRGEVRGEVEVGGFVQWNQEACPISAEENNPHMITHHGSFWSAQNRSSIHAARAGLVAYMRDTVVAQDLAGPAHWGEGRGVVMIAGNADTLQRVVWSVGMLRSYGSQLPVQVYHFPSEAPPADSPLLPKLRDLGVTLVPAPGQERSAGQTKSYHLKALAVVNSPWREVLYLDSDSVPARDPEYMFESPNFREFGIWLAPDYWKTSAASPMWAILGVRCRDEWETEAGQIYIDKSRHLDAMLLAKHMLENYQFWYKFSDGDKDIFRHSLLALRKRWAIPGRYLGAGALPSGTLSGEFCAHTMMQHDSWGRPLFVHYNLLKQIPSGVGRGYSWGRTKQMPLFQGEGERKVWIEGEGDEPEGALGALMGDDESPAPATITGGEPRGLGELGADDLADADDHGVTRSQRMPPSVARQVGRWMAGAVKPEVGRRAARERGWKTRYHGGSVSALCIDVDWNDPRSAATKEADEQRRARLSEHRTQREASWEDLVRSVRDRAQAHNAVIDSDEQGGADRAGERMSEEPPEDEKAGWEAEWAWVGAEEKAEERRPDWGQSPVEVVWWRDDEHLRDFENRIYDMGFVPSGPGF